MSRRLGLFLLVTVVQLAVLSGLLLHGRMRLQRSEAREIPARRQLARELGLTDLSLWTEARYTRHPSQADRFAPFQDAPSSVEHFPAGSIVAAPAPPANPRLEAP